MIDGTADGGGTATLTYRLTPDGPGTRFARELVYRMPNVWWALLDKLVIRRKMVAESEKAVRQLKRTLESEG